MSSFRKARKELRAGYARADITPPVGGEMSGFFARQQPSIGIHDRLFARAVVLESDEVRIGIVSCDLLGFHPDFDAELRGAISRATGISGEGLMIACTHTHSGAACYPLRGCGRMDVRWMRELRRRLVRVAVRAARKLHPVTARFGRDQADLARVRWLRSTARPNALRRIHPRHPEVSVIQFRRGQRPFLSVLHYACHPVVLGPENRRISADYPGAATAFLEEATGAPALFLNGASGNLNPKIAHQRPDAEGFRRLREIGETLGKSALRAIRDGRPLPETDLWARIEWVEVPLRRPSTNELRRTIARDRLALKRGGESPLRQAMRAAFLAWARESLRELASRKAPRVAKVSLQQMRLGPLLLVALGGEPYEALGARLQRRGGRPCLVVGYANGNLGYLPSREAFRYGGYEIEDAHKFYGRFGVGPSVEKRLASRLTRRRRRAWA